MSEDTPLRLLSITICRDKDEGYIIETTLPDPTKQFLWATGKTFPEALHNLADDLEFLIDHYGKEKPKKLSEDAKALRLWVRANMMKEGTK